MSLGHEHESKVYETFYGWDWDWRGNSSNVDTLVRRNEVLSPIHIQGIKIVVIAVATKIPTDQPLHGPLHELSP